MRYSKSNSCGSEGNQVFLCHSSHDKKNVREIGKWLEKLGIDAWIDEKEILPGESLIGKIQEGLVESQFVLAFLSGNSVTSKWVAKELSSSLYEEIDEQKIVVIPILLENCVLPAFLRDKVWIDFREGISAETVAKQISATISSYLKKENNDNFALGYVDKQWVRELSIHFVLTALFFFFLAIPSMYFMWVFSRWLAISLFFGLGGAALVVAGINSIYLFIEARTNRSSAFFLASTDVVKNYIIDPFRKRNRRFIDSLSHPVKLAIIIGGCLVTFSSILAVIFLGYGLFQAMIFLLESGWVNR